MGKVIAAYGGGFKPPTKGHFQVIEDALAKYPEIDEFIIYVGSGTRDGISQLESILVWEVYKNHLPMKVKIEPSKSPIGDIIRLGKNNPQDTVYFIIGSREGNEGDQKDYESRTKNIEEKYPNMEIKLITTPQGEISGTKARKALLISPEEFYKFTPEILNDNERGEVFDTLRQSISEILNENIPHSQEKFQDFFSKEVQHWVNEDTKDYGSILEYKIDLNNIYDYANNNNFWEFYDDINQVKVIAKLKPTSQNVSEFKFYSLQGGKQLSFGRLKHYNPKVMNTIFKIFIDEVLPSNGKILIQPFDYTRYRLFKALISKNLSPQNYNIKIKDDIESPIIYIEKKTLNENASYSKDISIQEKIDQLTQHMLDKGMNIEPLPKVEFVDGDSDNAREFLGKTAYYNPETQTITLFTEGRHPKDIVRSFSHEMIHHIQNLEGRLGNITTTNTQEDDNLNDIEAEANLKGTMTFRNWTDSLNEGIDDQLKQYIDGDVDVVDVDLLKNLSKYKQKNPKDLDPRTGGNKYGYRGMTFDKDFIKTLKVKNQSNGTTEYEVPSDTKITSKSNRGFLSFSTDEEVAKGFGHYSGYVDHNSSPNKVGGYVKVSLDNPNFILHPDYVSKLSQDLEYSKDGEKETLYIGNSFNPESIYVIDKNWTDSLNEAKLSLDDTILLSQTLRDKDKMKQIHSLLVQMFPKQKELLDYNYESDGFSDFRPFIFHIDKYIFEGPKLIPHTELKLDPDAYAEREKKYKEYIEGKIDKYFNSSTSDPRKVDLSKVPPITIDAEGMVAGGNHRAFLAIKQQKPLKAYQIVKAKNTHPNVEKILNIIGRKKQNLNEAIVGDKIECDNCNWSWNIVDGGDDLFICHKCGHDNKPTTEETLLEEEDQLMAEVVNPDGERFEYEESNVKGLYTYEDSRDNLYFARITYSPSSPPRFEFKVGWFEDNDISKPKYDPQLPPNTTGMDNLKRRNTVSKIYRDEVLPYLKNNQKLAKQLDINPISDLRYAFSKRLVQRHTPPEYNIDLRDGKVIISLPKIHEKKTKDPFGLNQYARELASGLEEAITLNEGRYDKITNQVSREVFTKFKEIYDSGAKKGNFTFSVGPDDEEIFSNNLEFNLEGYIEVSDEMYQPDGGANAGYDDDGEEITPLIQVSFKIPQDPKEFKWSEVSFDIKDIVRHEIEHLTQDGENVKSGKYLEDDQLLRGLIDAKMLPKSQYFKLEKEVDAMLQGLYFRAKKSRTPFKEVILNYFKKVGLTKEEQKQILNVWRKRRKALALPTF